MFTRTDIHCPSVIVPADYQFVSYEHPYNCGFWGVNAFLLECRARITRHMATTGGTYATHDHGGNCMVCGAHCIYTALFYHVKTNAYIRTGLDCAEKMSMGMVDAEVFKTAVKDATKNRAGKRKAEKILADAGLSDCWPIYAGGYAGFSYAYKLDADGNPTRMDGTPWTDADRADYWRLYSDFLSTHKNESIIRDIVVKLVKYGSISDKQINFLRTLLDRAKIQPQLDAERAAKKAAEAASAADCPIGRVDIEGTVLSIKLQNSYQFGPSIKILVKHDTGYKVWGSLMAMHDAAAGAAGTYEPPAEVGDYIAFRATVQPSDKDPKFGFFSRPTGGRIISCKPVSQVA